MTNNELKSKRISLALYLEGVRVPVIAAIVTAAINQPASANITIPAVPPAAKLKPRTLVHLFFNDFTTDEEDSSDQYKLMFEGEMVSWSFSKEPDNRHIILKCSDFTNWIFKIKPWQIMSQNFFDKTESLARIGQQGVPMSISGTEEDTALPRSLPTAIINQATQMPGVVHSILMSGVEALHWSRTRSYQLGLQSRFGAITDISYSQFILGMYWVKHRNLLNTVFMSGAAYPLGHSFTNIMQAFNYMLVPCPVAAKSGASFIRNDVISEYVVGDFSVGSPTSTKNFFYLPEHIGFTLPPRSNVIFPDQLIRLNMTVDFQKEITRLIGKWTSDKLTRASLLNTHYESIPIDLHKFSDNIQGGVTPEFRSTFAELTMEGNDEELMGVWPEIVNTEAFSSAAFHDDTGELGIESTAEDYRLSVRRMLYLAFKRMKFAARPVYALSTFHPHLIPGLPCMIADVHFPIMCQIHQLTHDVREGGESTTHVIGQFSRTIEEQSYKFVRQFSETMNYGYNPYDVGSLVYPSLFGYPDDGGCIATATGILSNSTPVPITITEKILALAEKAMKPVDKQSLIENLHVLLKQTTSLPADIQDPGYLPVVAMSAVIADYLNAIDSKDLVQFIDNFVRRDLVSFKDMFGDLGAIIDDEFPKVVVDDTQLSDTPFLEKRRAAVQDLSKFLDESDGMIVDERVPNTASILDILSRALPETEAPDDGS
jgi:hypothetical protein